jgi:hypothetical protein
VSTIGKCKCSESGEHRFEVRTLVYLDVERHHLSLDGDQVIIDDMEFSHVNDQYKGQWLSLEEDFIVSCADCGQDFDYDLSDEAKKHIGLQPIGNAPRVVGGPRGGLLTDE